MADVKLNPILEQVSGKVGDLVFRRYGDRTILARSPNLDGVEPTEAQRAHQERFRQAVVYGKIVMADPDSRSIYEEAAERKGVPVFSVTVADFFNAPTVDEIDLSGYSGAIGDTIAVRANDDTGVTAVEVAVTDADGSEIERGTASLSENGQWIYEAQTAVEPGTTVRVSVTATDRPGSAGQDQVETQL